MIVDSFYLSEDFNLTKATKLTSLSQDEIEFIVGRFNKNSKRAGKLRGEVIVKITGEVYIRHHFTKKVIWSN